MTNCRLCAGSEVRQFFSIERSPSSVEGLLCAAQLEDDQIITLNVLICDNCGFIQLPHSPLTADFYRNYDKSAAHSEKMRRYQKELAAEIDCKFHLDGKSILEIGCGDGFFSMVLGTFGANVQCVEPGIKAAEMARSRGVAVLENYFSSSLPFKAKQFDIIVIRQVLSHIEDLNTFMVAIEKFLKTDGLIFVEVPNVDKAIAEKQYYDFFADYVNYFSPATLNRLMENGGFLLVECSSRMNGDYTLGIFRKPLSPDFMADFDGFSKSLTDIVRGERLEGRRVACWGAGGRGISLLVMCGFNQDDIAFVIDSSPDKQGLFTPGSKIEVVAPSILSKEPIESIMITAIMFQEEILKSLIDDFQFPGRVILLTPQPHIIDL